MADNTTLADPSGSAPGDNIRNIDRGGPKTQVVQLDIGGAAAESLVTGTMPVSGTVTANVGTGTQPVSAVSLPLPAGAATEVSLTGLSAKFGALGQGLMAASAPVVIASNQTALPVTDNAGSLTVDAPVATPVFVRLSDGAAPIATLPVSLATLPALTAGAAVIGALTANQTVNVALINGIAPLMGNGATGTGSQRVTIASDNTAFSVNAIQATLTKGTQGATGVSTQDLKDAGRVIFSAAVVIAGVTTVTTEALLSMVPTRDGVAGAAIATFPVTANKRLRITGVTVGFISTAVAVLSMRFALRMNPSGAATATSPILRILALDSGAALAQAGNGMTVDFPDGIEFSGTHQFGLTQIGNAITGTCWASITGFEY